MRVGVTTFVCLCTLEDIPRPLDLVLVNWNLEESMCMGYHIIRPPGVARLFHTFYPVVFSLILTFQVVRRQSDQVYWW